MEKYTDLIDLLDTVNDEDSFLDFLDAMAEEFAKSQAVEAKVPSPPFSQGAMGWENSRIDTFLDAAIRGAEQTAKLPDWKNKDDNVWRRCAEIIYFGKVYE